MLESELPAFSVPSQCSRTEVVCRTTAIVCLLATSLAVVAVSVLGADDADVTQSFSMTIPHGFPRFAIVASIEDNGRSVTIGQPEHFGGTVPLNESAIEARAYITPSVAGNSSRTPFKNAFPKTPLL